MVRRRSLRQADLDRLMRAVHHLYGHCDLDHFPHRVVDAIEGLVPADSIGCAEFSADWAQGVRRPDDSGVDRYLPGLIMHLDEHPAVDHYRRHGLPPAMAVSDVLSQSDWDRLAINREFYHKVGLRDQLNLLLPAPPGWVRSAAFARSEFGFDPREGQLLEQLRPHLIQAYHNAEAVTALQYQASDPVASAVGLEPPVARLTPDGRVAEVNEEARTLLKLYLDRTMGGPVEDGLPELVRRWCSVQRAQGDDMGKEGASPSRPLTVRGPFGVFVLRLLSDPETGGWRIVMRERPYHRVTDERIEALPPRRRQVLQLLLRGYAEKQIGPRLGLSRHTVHSYIKLLYRHFEVSSRGELLAAFIR